MNVGSFFRSADSFRIDSLKLCGITAQPPHKEILKTAIGADHTVKWTYHKEVVDAIKELKSQDFEIIGIEQTDSSVTLKSFKIDPSKKYAIVLGNEVNGISDSALPHLDHVIEIEQFGTKHSLNVSACAGIVMFEFAKGMRVL